MIEVAGDIRNREELPEACAFARDLIYLQSEGEELLGDELETLEVHVAQCEACAAERNRVKHFTTSISDLLSALKPAEDLRRKVLKKIEANAEKRKTHKPLIALVGACLLAVIVLIASHEQPLAQLSSTRGSPRVLRPVGTELRSVTSAQDLEKGDRLQLDDGDEASLTVGRHSVVMRGPSLAQLDRTPSGQPLIHILKEAHLGADAGSTELHVCAGTVRVRASNARYTLDVDEAGTCRIDVSDGHVSVLSAAGGKAVTAASSLEVDQQGNMERP
jgi:hypothetical protein